MVTKSYSLQSDPDRLIFKTSSFKAEKTSVLHSGVYTKEFTSMLVSTGTCIAAFLLLGLAGIRSLFIRVGIVIVIFVIAFLGASKYIFKDKYLQVIFDRSDKMIEVIRSGLVTKNREKIPFSDLSSVEVGSKKYVPENIDGIDFVQKISAQHGSAVPGLSETEEFITLSLKLIDEREIIIYAAKIENAKVDGEPELPLSEIRSFLKLQKNA